jgi:hypothetical protein
MVDWLTRDAWGARPPEAKVSLVRSQVKGTAIHWPGMTGRIDAAGAVGQRRVASALRGWQDYHMDTRGWRDIAYQAAVDQAGRKWTLRGLNLQSGANGNEAVNDAYGAILLVLGPGEEPSAAMKSTVQEVIAEFRRLFPAALLIRPHSAVRPEGTDCPGDRARACIARGDFTPGHDTGDDVTPEQMNQLLAAIAKATNAANAAAAAANTATSEAKVAAQVAANAPETAGRRWALYQLRYALQTEDERAAAREEYTKRIAAGDSEEQAMAAVAAKLKPLDDQLRETQGKG